MTDGHCGYGLLEVKQISKHTHDRNKLWSLHTLPLLQHTVPLLPYHYTAVQLMSTVKQHFFLSIVQKHVLIVAFYRHSWRLYIFYPLFNIMFFSCCILSAFLRSLYSCYLSKISFIWQYNHIQFFWSSFLACLSLGQCNV